jgi:phosphonate transport system substrate-binding protein
MKVHIFITIFLFQIAVLAQENKPEYTVGVHPLHSPSRLLKVFSPLIDHINTNAKSFKLKIETTGDYSEYNTQIKVSRYDIILPNPYQTIKALNHGYKVISKWGDDSLFRGIFLVRKDSKIKSFADFKGKTISFPAPTALAAALMPKYHLYENKVLEKDYTSIFVGNQESSILAVANGTSDVGVTWYPPWNLLKKEKAGLLSNLEVFAETSSLPNNSVMVKSKMKAESVKELTELLVNLNNSEEGKKILGVIGIPAFEVANEKTYEPVKSFIKKYEKNIGAIAW